MSIFIRALKLEVLTEESEKHTSNIIFKTKGLNIIRAENSMGKSTSVQSIIYALGMESMLGQRHQAPLPPAMKSKITIKKNNKDECEFNVVESRVFLEIENSLGEKATIVRDVKSNNDHRLIKVYDEAVLTEKSGKPSRSPSEYYARVAGSSKNELGFYNWLKKFLGWKLPEVQLNTGGKSELYLETIVPLFVIEQKAGWGQIQANTPYFQIRDVKQRVLEFVLGLDAYKNYQNHLNLKKEMEKFEEEWRKEFLNLSEKSNSLGGYISEIPKAMPTSWPPSIEPSILFNYDGKSLNLQEYMEYVVSKLTVLNEKYEINVENLSEDLKKELSEQEERAFYLQSYLRELNSSLSSLNSEISDNEERLMEFSAELKQLADIQKIQKWGGQTNYSIDTSKCPTCSQNVSGSILRKDVNVLYMTLDENIAFIKNESEALSLITENLINKKEKISKDIISFSKEINETRERIREIKDTLVQSGKGPSRATFEEILRNEKKLENLKTLKNDFEIVITILADIFKTYDEIKGELKGLKDMLSTRDKEKLSELKNLVKSQLELYGFKSFNINDLTISNTTYHPALDDIDWYFDVSASDNVRGLWAYTLALHEVVSKYKDGHLLGFTLFDEPRQHSAKGDSFNAFLKKLKSAEMKSFQSIVFTSEPVANLKHFVNDPAVQFINYEEGERVIKHEN